MGDESLVPKKDVGWAEAIDVKRKRERGTGLTGDLFDELRDTTKWTWSQIRLRRRASRLAQPRLFELVFVLVLDWALSLAIKVVISPACNHRMAHNIYPLGCLSAHSGTRESFSQRLLPEGGAGFTGMSIIAPDELGSHGESGVEIEEAMV